MEDTAKADVLKRLNYIEGHLNGIKKMVANGQYCVDILKQTYAVRKAIERLEARVLEGHLRNCVPSGIAEGNTDKIVAELMSLYELKPAFATSDQAAPGSQDEAAIEEIVHPEETSGPCEACGAAHAERLHTVTR